MKHRATSHLESTTPAIAGSSSGHKRPKLPGTSGASIFGPHGLIDMHAVAERQLCDYLARRHLGVDQGPGGRQPTLNKKGLLASFGDWVRGASARLAGRPAVAYLDVRRDTGPASIWPKLSPRRSSRLFRPSCEAFPFHGSTLGVRGAFGWCRCAGNAGCCLYWAASPWAGQRLGLLWLRTRLGQRSWPC